MTSTITDRIDGISTSVAIKAPCRAATTANITLSGEQTIDGVACVAGDRVLVKNQSVSAENGIWVVSASAWQRAKDFNGARDVVTGTLVKIISGTTNSGMTAEVSTTGAITVGVTGLSFTLWDMNFNNYVAKSGALMEGDLTFNSGAQVVLDDSVTSASSSLPLCFDGEQSTGIFRPTTSSISLATGGRESLRVTISSASAVNYVQVSGHATANSPIISSQGSDANVGLTLSTKGTGNFAFQTGGGNQLTLAHTANAVNQLQISGAATGSFPTLSSQGSDTNIGLNLLGKGTGRVRLGNNNVYGLTVTTAASAVNYIEVTGVTTGNRPTIAADGTDANIGMILQTKGTGSLVCLAVYNTTTASAANVFVDAGGILYRSTSSLKYKTNVQDYARGLGDLMKLRPVTYGGLSEADAGKTFAGFIAEEVHEAGLTEYVVYDDKNEPDALQYGQMIALAVKAIQDLKAKVDELESRLAV